MSEDATRSSAPSLKPPWYKELHWQIALGLLLALIYAGAVRAIWPAGAPDDAAHLSALAAWQRASAPFAFLGDLFLRALKLIIIPLVVLSIVTGIKSLSDGSQLGRLGARTVAYYVISTALAVGVGLLVVNLIEPGAGQAAAAQLSGEAIDPRPLSEVFSAMIPENALEALASNAMLPSIFVAVLLGAGLLAVGEQARALGELVEAGNAVILKITDWIMATAPIGVAALLVTTLLDTKLADLAVFFVNLGEYMISVLVGLGAHAALTLPLMLWWLTRRNPLDYARALAPSLMTAFSTASSSATYPVTLECVTERAGVSPRTASFVLPLGATINMDGTALYEAVAAIFIANALGVELTFSQQAVVAVTATLAAIGAAGVPSAGLVTMIIVLESVGLPAEAYGMVVAVDRLLDMCRTTVNVWGDAVGAAIVDGLGSRRDPSNPESSPARQ